MQLNVTGTRDFALVRTAEYIESHAAGVGLILRESRLEVWQEIDELSLEQYRLVMEEALADYYADRRTVGRLTVPARDAAICVVEDSYDQVLALLRRDIPELADLDLAEAPPEQLARELRGADVTPREWHGLWFRSYTEQRIAEALDRANVLFVPNATARLGVTQDHRVNHEPDFLVVCDGKFGILEVDGPFGHGGDDHERARLFKEHGVAVVEHFPWQECYELPDEVVERFLRLLRLNG